jgi:hypothetical protein
MKFGKKTRSPLIAVIALQFVALIVVAWNTGPGWDEWGHLPSGLFSLQFGDYSPYCVNPPLTRLWCAIPVSLAGGGIAYETIPHDIPGFRSEWALNLLYIEQQRGLFFFWMSLARTAAIPISLLGTWLIWRIGENLFSAKVGIIAASLWAFSPTVLTFGASITPDVTAAVFGLLAAWHSYVWLRIGTPKKAFWLGLTTGLAMLSKASWLILPPLLGLITVTYGLMHSRGWNWIIRLKQGAIVVGISWLTIHAMYEFEGTFVPLGQFDFISRSLAGSQHDSPNVTPQSGNRFRDNWIGCIPAPLPAAYIRGIDIQKHDFESKMNSYFFGEWRDHGWWYYYIVGIWLKEPIAMWFLTLWGMGIWGAKHFRLSGRIRMVSRLIVFAPGTALFVFVSSQTGFNHHLRYVLPFLPCFYLLVAASFSKISDRRQYIVVVLVAWYACSSLSILPRSYAYFTEVIGGPSNGWKYLGDSNLDWGQDILTAKHWIETNPDNRPVHLVYSLPMIDFHKLGIDAEDGQPFVSLNGPTQPGWWIVFSRPLLNPENQWFVDNEPTEKLSVTTSVFEISAKSALNSNQASTAKTLP